MIPPVYAMVCAGGGAHGAYQVGVLKYVHEHFCRDGASPFTLFVGTSCGSLNAAYAASRSYDAIESRLDLERRWLAFHVPEYHGNVIVNSMKEIARRIRPFQRERPWSLLSPRPLENVVASGFQRESLERSIEARTTLGLAVSATEIRTGRLCWFVDGPRALSWNVTTSMGSATPIEPRHVVASCSVPFVFPPVDIDGYHYCDGGIANKSPLGPALGMGATRIMTIGTERPLPTELPPPDEDDKLQMRELILTLTEEVFRDYATRQAEIVCIVNDALAMHPEISRVRKAEVVQRMFQQNRVSLDDYHGVEIELVQPSKRIQASRLFQMEALDLPKFESGSSRLQFREEFVRDLIRLGYDDAHARHERFARFFDFDRPHEPTTLTDLLASLG